MKQIFTIILITFSLNIYSQTFVSTTPENKNAIIEVFTGIYCGFCPDGHVMAEALHTSNPNDVFVSKIHTGGYANPNGPSDPDFNTIYGAAIANASGLAGFPAGTVNRATFSGISPQGSPGTTALSRGDWAAATAQILAQPSYVNIGAQASFDMSTGILTVNTETYYTSTTTNSNYLHVAVIEDNVPGPQSGAQNYNPGAIIPGPWTPTYNHTDMFRHLMDGANGLQYPVTTTGTFAPNTHTWTMPTNLASGQSTNGYFPDLDPTNMDVIAFITDATGEIITGIQADVICIFPNAYDVNLTAASSQDVMCATTNDISITFRNYGNLPLTSVDLNYDINGGTPGTYNWTGNLASGAKTTVTVPNVSFIPQPDNFGNPGNTVNWTATNPNGQVDQDFSNNTISSFFSHHEISGNVVQGITAGNISVDITTDGYPAETSWELVGEDGTVYGSGGPYSFQGTQPTAYVSVPGNVCVEFILYDSYGDGMCCANGVGSVLVQDVNGTLIFEGDPINLQNFTVISSSFSTGPAIGPAWECSPFGCVEGTPGLGVYMTESQCESDPTTGCYVGPTWNCDPLLGCFDVGVAGLGTFNTEQECINNSPCNAPLVCNFIEDFEQYGTGDPIAETSQNWNTWGEFVSNWNPPFPDDAYISNAYSYSGNNSLAFNSNSSQAGPEDIILSLSNSGAIIPITTGTFTFKQNLFIVSGAYLNFQGDYPGTSWVLDMTFDANGIVNYSSLSNNIHASSAYPLNQWFEQKIIIDLTNNTWEIYHDGNLIGSFSVPVNQISYFNYYPMVGNEFYVDDICMEYNPYQPDPLNAQLMNIFPIDGLEGQNKYPSVEVRNLGLNNINSFDVTFEHGGSQITENVSGLNLTSMQTHTVDFTNSISLSSVTTAVAYVHNINGGQLQNTSDDTLTTNLNVIIPAPGKLVIGERATGTWVGWCPRGIVNENWMHHKYEGYYQGIAVHNGDPMVDPTYDNGIAGYISGYPSGLINRGGVVDPTQFEQEFLQKISSPPAVQIQNISTRNNDTLTVNMNLNFVNSISGSLKVACVLVEDSVTGSGPQYYQANFYSGGNQGSLIDVDGTDWANLPANVPDYMMIYRNVARSIQPSYLGELMPANYYSFGQNENMQFNFYIDPSWNLNNLKIVSFFIDSTGQIDNAAATKYFDALNNSFTFYGCTDSSAINYDSNANSDDGSCDYPVFFCDNNTYDVPINDIIIGTTTYDLQSNSSIDNRLIKHNDGTISATWTYSNEYVFSFSDRGTGYNYFDGTSWNTSPSSRIESSKGGWPSILTTGSGKEIIISHNNDSSTLQMTHRPQKGTGSWVEETINTSIPNWTLWPRAVIGGSNNESIHLIGTALGYYNGLSNALLYYRSQDGGVTWDILDMQLPTLDSIKYNGFSADNYAIDAKGDTIVIAYFGKLDDSVILKSTDNGNTWTKTVFLDFPIDKYIFDTGIDLDFDGINDTVYTTDGYGSIVIDNNGLAHVFFGNMKYLDADLTDGNYTFFPGTNGLMYWNENMGEDNFINNQIKSPSLWYSSKPKMIAQSQDLDGDGLLNFLGIPSYYSSLTSMPSSGIDTAGNLYVTYSSLMENIDNGLQNYMHINLITSKDGGNSWSCPIDLNYWIGQGECVFGKINRNVDDKLIMIYQYDTEPGLAVRGDMDNINNNTIRFVDCYTTDILKEGCTDPFATNYDITAIYDGPCTYCDITAQIVTTNPSDSSSCDGVIIVNTTSSYPITSYSISDFQGNILSSNNFAFGLCNGVYFISVIDSSGCSSLDTLVLGIVGGCMDSTALNYNYFATYDDGSCTYPTIFGCTDSNAYNYNPFANTDDGSCLYCDLTNSFFISQNTPGLCDGFIVAISNSSNLPISHLWNTGSTQNNILNLCDGIYSITITDNVGCIINDTVVIGTIFGCTDSTAINFDPFANSDDGSCLYCDLSNNFIVGQNSLGNCDGFAIANSSSSYGPISYLWSTGSTQNNITNLCSGIYSAIISDSIGCIIEDTVYIGIISGCTDPNAINYNPNATVDDGSCSYCIYGCTDPLALNYDPNATCDDGSCTYNSNCTSPKPTGLYAYDVIDTRAKIGWDNMNDANCMVWKYFVRYREVGTSQWTTKSAGVGNGLCNFGLNTVTKQLLNLAPSTTYEFRMKAFYCGGTSSNYSTPVQFTTADVCPDMTNLTATTFNGNQAKVRFNWDTTGAYTFARILLRVDTAGSAWQTAGGFGVYYPTLFVNKFGLTPGQSYRAQGRTFCDSNITAYRSPTWTAPIFWNQPGSIREGGGLSINNLDIYPNPSRDVFNISFNTDKIQDLKIRIFNIVGAEIYNENKENFIGEYIKQISLNNYGKGIYFLEIETNNGIINKKLILQ